MDKTKDPAKIKGTDEERLQKYLQVRDQIATGIRLWLETQLA